MGGARIAGSECAVKEEGYCLGWGEEPYKPKLSYMKNIKSMEDCFG